MTADIRAAAQREAHGRFKNRFLPDLEMRNKRSGFADGAVWAAARVTPDFDQLAMTVAQFFGPNDSPEDVAKAVLKLMAGLAEGEAR